MNIAYLLAAIGAMALVSYLPRVLPLALFRKKIKNRFVLSLLTYMPYGLLAAMVFPAVFYSTSSIYSAMAGTVVALVLAYKNKGLLIVAVSATAAVFLVELLMNLLNIPMFCAF